MVAVGVFFTEGLASVEDRLPIGGAIPIAKGFADRYREIRADDEGFHADDVGVVFGLAEGAGHIIFGGIKFCIREADLWIVDADQVVMPGMSESDGGLFAEVN